MEKPDLDTCAQEPIHIPGHIQPHGALLAFNRDGTLRAWSQNTASLLGFEPGFDVRHADLPLAADIQQLLAEVLADPEVEGETRSSVETVIAGRTFDCIVHAAHGLVVAEFELRDLPSDQVSLFAFKAHSAIDRLKRQKTVTSLLQLAVEQVRAITGFDRVMAYRFRHDDSGDVVAESVRDGLPPFIGMRYPASDIPAQARRLYVLNTLRLIVDVSYHPVPVVGRAEDGPLDMSYCVLRSVSPIHVEYLQNMGVGASMSVSIVINGRLWGLLACHHMSALQVPYSLRMACDVIAQLLGATVHSLISREREELANQSAELRTHLIETMLHEEDVMSALERHAQDLARVLDAPALVFSQQGKLAMHGDVPRALAAALVASLPPERNELVVRNSVDDFPEDVRSLLGQWAGMLALHFDPATDGWLVALRPEQVEMVRWAGKPEKSMRVGPLGPRLTPRGSFDEWRDTVRGKAVPWDDGRLLVAEQLLGEMHRASMARHAETERARMQLLAMLGHDLRDPLQSITMAAAVLKHGKNDHQLGQRIQNSSGRMERLIGQIMDMIRLDRGLGLDLRLDAVNVSQVLEDLVDETRLAHPSTQYTAAIAPDVVVNADPDRLAQVISNLLSNARHHGQAGFPVSVSLAREDGLAVLEVSNRGEKISDQLEPQLFSPFKHGEKQPRTNRTGMGLGLYIASRVVQAHGGKIAYVWREPHVVFRVELPAA